MKKFGTPIGAAPGSESEKVGLLVPGTPLPEGRTTFFFFLALGPEDRAGVPACGCVDGFCFLAGLPASGVGVVLDLEVEVEVEVVLELERDVVVVDPEAELELVVVVVVVELPEVGVQVSVSDTTTPEIGSFRLEIGVPGGTFTENV
ncbi:MAG: hypothetical protein ACR2GZ_08375 [Solirubrobacteraceae bacterium]